MIPTEQRSNSKRIFLIDDDPDVTLFFKMALEGAGFTVDAYNDPIQAISKFRSNFYDLLLIDIRMPVLDGFHLYKKLRRRDKVKACFITSFEEYYQSIKQEHPLLEKELSCLIRKPISLKDFLNHIKNALNPLS
jgi:CheY-like chemotaxis protein